MRDSRKSRAGLLALAVAVVLLLTRVSGLDRRIVYSVLEPPHGTGNTAQELAFDQDGDGQLDQWWVTIRESEPYECVYQVTDSHGDGTPDRFGLLRPPGLGGCGLRDDDNDGWYDRQVITTRDVRDTSSGYAYHDLDFDGKLDIMVQKKRGAGTVAAYLFMNETLVRVLLGKSSDSREAWIEGVDGSKTRVVFQDGQWQVAR